MILFDHHPQFFTATNLNWLPILQSDTCKQIVIDGLKFRIKLNQVTVYAYVIMPNHLHLIWQIRDGIKRKDFQRDFLKFTAKHILNWLSESDKDLYSQLKVNDKDRMYQVWERNSLSIDIYNEPVFDQKMKYIHTNPLQPKWQLCATPTEYKYSSANFYENGFDEFEFLKHYRA